jgi:hypothetical protein
MRAKLVVFAIAMTILSACQQQQQASPPDSASAGPLDPFVVMIGAERWGVIIDKAREGVREAPEPAGDYFENEMYRADASLKSSAARLIELRNAACMKGLVTGEACNLQNWPAWTGEPPTDKTPIEEIQRRSDWLSKEMDPFTSAGCEAGRKATGDDLFCSVE